MTHTTTQQHKLQGNDQSITRATLPALARLALVIMAIFFSASICSASASKVYVAQSSAGAANGADCADAFPLTWFNNSGNWGSGGTQIGPGTTVHLCGTITSSLSPQGNGTSGSPITILFESGAKISVPACGSGCISLDGLSYIIVDGSPTSTPCGYVNNVDVGCNGTINSTNTRDGQSTVESIGIEMQNASHVEIRNLLIENMWVHSSGGPDLSGLNYAIHFSGTNNLIHNNQIHDAAAGAVGESPNSANQFYNNQVWNCNWGIFHSGPSSNTADAITNDTIHDNDIYDFANWDNTADSFHHDGIFVAGNNNVGNGISHIDIYNNYVHGTTSDPSMCAAVSGSCMTAYIYVNDDNHVRIFNNLVVANPGAQIPNNGLILMFVDSNDSLMNNTLIGGQTTDGNPCIHLNSGTSFTFENNIVSNCSDLVWKDGSSFASLNNNVYQSGRLSWRVDSSGYSSLASWQSAAGGDSGAVATTGSLGLSSSYVPNSGSMVISAGANLTNMGITALDSDKAAVARPSSGSWSSGAYQLASSVQQPAAPTGLFATVQ